MRISRWEARGAGAAIFCLALAIVLLIQGRDARIWELLVAILVGARMGRLMWSGRNKYFK